MLMTSMLQPTATPTPATAPRSWLLAKLGPTDLRIASMQDDQASDDQDDEEDDRYHAPTSV